LGKEICAQFYDHETAEKAAMEFNKIFVHKDIPDDVPEYRIPAGEIDEGKIWIVKVMVLAGLAKSNGEARRLIQGGGVSFKGERIGDDDYELVLPAEGIIKVGKRRFVKIVG
jgi:tyrosyl-tRNA synthetase